MPDPLRAIDQSSFLGLRIVDEEGLLADCFQFRTSFFGQPPFLGELGLRLEGVVPHIQGYILEHVGRVLR